uniref:Single stranded DNA binding protein 4 n=1 Tax=Monopterus albus TaxID=43700 RepID=A0A3Q3JNZ6_MONAL
MCLPRLCTHSHIHTSLFLKCACCPCGSGDMDGLPKNSPNNMAGMNNPPGTPRDDGEMAGNFLNPFQSESYSPNMTMSV